MAHYTQANHPLTITTPLGEDALLLEKLSGTEAISELFCFQIDLLAEEPVPFEQVLGQAATLTLAWPDQPKRYVTGIVNRFSQEGRVRSADGATVLLRYQAELVPRLWLLTKRLQSRIFQHLSVPDILKQVLKTEWQLEVKFQFLGAYPARDYCVQYRESDFAFVSRLMEDEGIFYYFVHTADNHTLVVSDAATIHPELPGRSTILFDEVAGGHREETHITSWKKSQELRACKVNLWDYCFELPTSTFEAQQTIPATVAVGQSTHPMNLQVAASNGEMLQILDYPGGYAKRFDGINKGGAEQPAEIQKIFQDNQRTANIRMEQEAVAGLTVEGASDCAHFVPGHHFNLDGHFFADGRYLLTQVNHEASMEGAYVTGRDDAGFLYTNRFQAIPLALPYRPQQRTPKPVIVGTQTATVVGPKGEEIFTDKYGRVKVQFHWDRHGKKNADSSCWVRVAQPWAGGGFGAIAIPRVGHEVVVAFEEGDPDQPIILGCVYNAGQMPPFKLPENRMFSGIKSNSVGGNPSKNFSGLAINDTSNGERVALYAEKNMMVNSEHDLTHHVGHYQHSQIGHMSLTTVGGIPGVGGGSGGGGGSGPTTSATTKTTVDDQGNLQQTPEDPSYGNWKTSNGLLSAQPGMAGSVIYGVNSQDTVGFMHQVTVGAAYQICINPLGYLGFIPNPAAGGPWSGLIAGIGGNVQLCFGSNTQAVYGPSITINHGPQISITAKPWALTWVLAPIVAALSLAYELSFGAMYNTDKKDDQASDRADLFAASVGVIGLATTALLASETADRTAQQLDKAATALTVDTLLSTSLGMADSKQLPDFLKKKIHDALQTKQTLKPDDPLAPLDDAHSITFVDGVLLQTAKHIHLIAMKKSDEVPPDPNPSTFYISAAGKGDDGVAFITATKGLTLTSGGAFVELVNKENTSGDLTMQCGLQGQITFCRLPVLAPLTVQNIQLKPQLIEIYGGPDGGIMLDAGPPPIAGGSEVTLDPKAGITLECGPNKITIDQQGVTIDAINITLNAKAIHKETSQMKKITATLAQMGITVNQLQ